MKRRGWWLLAAIVACIAIAAAGFVTMRPQPSEALPQGIPYSYGACHDYSPSAGADDLNHIANSVWDPMFIGADVGESVRLGDGRSLWLFGDTSRLINGEVAHAVRNTMLMAGPRCLAVVAAAGAKAAIPDRPDGVGYWPMDALTSYADGVTTIYVSAERVTGLEEMMNFTNDGPAIATFQIPDGGPPYYQGTVDLGPDDASKSNVGWGSAMAVGDDGYWYLFGTANPDQPWVFGWSVSVARVKPATIRDQSTWEYWNGSAWSPQASTAHHVIEAADGVSQTFSVFRRDDTWYAVSKLQGDYGEYLAVWTSPHPWGPWGEPVTVGRIPNRADLSIVRYMPIAHPDLASSTPNSIVVSVSRNTFDQQLLKDRPDLYRPFFIEIPVPPRHSHRFLDPLQFPGKSP